ncbi:OHCU decarboxylase [Kouleothrix aurantiaca]|jgi:OHCU decarboxylase|uniref:2-oxo-4-hydroxy-4-carboxy-5-ureidoimidazoline decarboxylase n=1 Tax=Kouleothrix aurantiaca TaxID=186479 RepID=A0A0P9FHE8_9CHLR|nr:OHCU decarboxylase [Kouleothrix aurantiaca]
MPPDALTLDEINALGRDAFVARLGFVFERSPWVAAAAWDARPFRSRAALHAAMVAAMWAAPREQQLALIRAHPDLAGKAAIAKELTAESTREQASAGLDRLTPAEFARFTELNDAYRARFAFPFIICVREHTKASILANFVERIAHSPDDERHTALGEIAKIAALRLNDAVRE